MPEAGQTISHFRLIEKIGAGGMGEVYKAKDQKLGRDVAIKILPEEFAQDKDRVARFQREAKLLASLNHPNIAAIHGLEQAEGIHFLVLELIEGDTLADRIKGGPIPVEESLKLALQIAEALEAAHGKGVIHRDLKPANIKVTPEGKVKVLDFGLAKAFAGDPEEMDLSNSPTLSLAATQQGVILGTAAYMSPEQAKGKLVDKRTDIWAFGVVLFEMLSGRPAFEGEDVPTILARVVDRNPDFSTFPSSFNPRLSELLQSCLEKRPKRRYHDIADVRLVLEKILADPGGLAVRPVAEVAPVAPRSKRAAVIGTFAAVVLAVIAAFAAWMLKPSDPRPVIRWEYKLPIGIVFGNPQFDVLKISPDGRYFVYSTLAGLRMRRMDTLEEYEIPGAAGPLIFAPTLSPDGQSIAFVDGPSGQLSRISIEGGAAVRLASMQPGGLNWETDDTILYSQPDGIWEVAATGGEPQKIIEAEAGELLYGPRRLPGGKRVMFTVSRATGSPRWDEDEIVVQSPNSEDRKVLLQGGSDARYVPTGHLIYAFQNALFAVPFDLDNLKVTGGAVSMVEGIRRSLASGALSGAAFYDITEDGTLVYVPGSAGNGGSMLAWIDAEGNAEAIDVPTGDYIHPRISADGRWLAVERAGGDGADIWIYETSGKTELRRLTEGENNRYPVWSRDGEYVAFQSEREGDGGIFRRRADGTGSVDRLTTPERGSRHIPESWSPTRDILAFSVVKDDGVELWMLNVEDGSTERFGDVESNTPFDAVFSPDGKWIAYTQRGHGVSTWIHSAANPQTRYQIRQDQESVHHPLWTRDGAQLVYFPGSRPAQAVDIRTEPSFGIGKPVRVPGIGSANTSTGTLLNHDVAPDGRFVVARSGLAADGVEVSESVIIVQNWFEELKERVPAK